MHARFLIILAICLGILSSPALQAKKKVPEPERWIEYQGEKIPLYSTKSFPPKKTTAPEYPAEEKAAGIQGHAVALVLIDVEGRIAELLIQKSEPGISFGVAAEKSIRKWQFQKLEVDGKPARYLIHAPVFFRISRR